MQNSTLFNILFQERPSSEFASKGLLFLRILTGLGLFLHGLPKMMAPTGWMGDALPGVLQLLAVISEVGGGLALIFGFLVPFASLGIFITMLVGIVLAHLSVADPLFRITVSNTSAGAGTDFFGLPLWFAKAGGHSEFGSGSAELAILYLAISFSFFFTGGGIYSIDHIYKRNK